ncbi:MarR family winged helix-turn-helix transcriptional regulator [Streptomyces sp. NPDC046821]|uniref:MarR family winged helix-turn-helix transcriptional regulator n=1 Tax=Streptomyces sp. NPDC046821 TaxID=3154702 RepID=UPI0033EFC643
MESVHATGEQSAGTPHSEPLDAIDEMIGLWQACLPEAEVRSLEVVSRMLRITRLFDRDRDKTLSRFGLEPWSFDMLAALRRDARQQSTPGELMAATLVTSGTMTTRLKSLESRGWITRTPDPVDRRIVVVKLTTEGRKVIDEAFGEVLSCQRELIRSLSGEEFRTAAQILKKILLDHEGPARLP